MKIKVETSVLKNLIESVIGAVATKPATPVLGGMKISAKDGKITLEAQDGTLAIRNSVEAEVEEEGSVLVVAERINDIVRNVDGDTISMTSDDATLKVSSANVNYKLLTMNVRDFPSFPVVDDADKSMTIPMEDFNRMAKQTIFACGKDPARPIFNGIYCHVVDGKLRFVGTNTHRLAIAETDKNTGDAISAIIPATCISLVQKLFNTDILTIAMKTTRAIFKMGDWTMVTATISGNFPNYAPLLSKPLPDVIEADRNILSRAIARVRLCCTDETIPVKLFAANDNLRLLTNDHEYGEAEENVTIHQTGEPVNIAFRGKYIAEGLKALLGDTVKIETGGTLTPVLITDTEHDDFKYIVTPVRVVF